MDFLRHKFLITALVIVVLLPMAMGGLAVYQWAKLPMISSSKPSMIISIDRAMSASQFVHRLEKNQLIKHGSLFLLMIRLQGLSHQLKAGLYEIKPGETAIQLLHRVVMADVMTHHFTVIAGTTQAKIDQDLMQMPHLIYQPQDWDLIKTDHQSAEGLLLAETYQYRAGSTSRELLNEAHTQLMNYLNQCWQTREPELPYKTPYELLIAASIIEKETAIAAERQLIAGIVVNRLKKSMPLQMDPTVIYGMATRYHGKLLHSDLSIDSPYNSYRYRGLPPTPIAMVGKEAIQAAAHPQRSNFLYFVAKGDGTHQFSETYLQQRQAIHHFLHKDAQ